MMTNQNPMKSNLFIWEWCYQALLLFLMHGGIMYKYIYDGPVLSFGVLITDRWVGETMAVTKKKARSNLYFQCKRALGLSGSAAISLPGTIKEERIEYVG